jgi:uncharacterized protein
MALTFEPIRLDRRDNYLDRLRKCHPRASDYSFVNIWGWGEEYGLTWAWDDDLVWFRQTRPEEVFWAPVGDWEAIDWNGCFKRYFKEPATFIRVPERLSRIWAESTGPRLRVEEARGHWDYIYDIPELIELKGKRFHKKKNLFNQFTRKYDFVYRPFDPEIIRMALGMQKDWCAWRDCESSETLLAENRAISRVMTEWNRMEGIVGGALLVGDSLIAYTVAERLTEDTLVIHFEKGSLEYKGVYQAINQMFLADTGKSLKWVNREQDLDDEGLRKAKLSYQPVDFVKKYKVTVEIG